MLQVKNPSTSLLARRFTPCQSHESGRRWLPLRCLARPRGVREHWHNPCYLTPNSAVSPAGLRPETDGRACPPNRIRRSVRLQPSVAHIVLSRPVSLSHETSLWGDPANASAIRLHAAKWIRKVEYLCQLWSGVGWQQIVRPVATRRRVAGKAKRI